MTDSEKINLYKDACISDMHETGVLASVSLVLILAGRADSPQGAVLKRAHNGKRNRGKLLYPGIGKCRTFAEAMEILGDDGTLAYIERRWGLSRRFDGK